MGSKSVRSFDIVIGWIYVVIGVLWMFTGFAEVATHSVLGGWLLTVFSCLCITAGFFIKESKLTGFVLGVITTGVFIALSLVRAAKRDGVTDEVVVQTIVPVVFFLHSAVRLAFFKSLRPYVPPPPLPRGMQAVLDVTGPNELKELRDKGTISEEEYQQRVVVWLERSREAQRA